MWASFRFLKPALAAAPALAVSAPWAYPGHMPLWKRPACCMDLPAPVMPEPSRTTSRRQHDLRTAELELLSDLAAGKKTFAQVSKDAKSFKYAGTGLGHLVSTNPARGVAERLKQLTGVSKSSLFFANVKCKEGSGDSGPTAIPTMRQPFVLLSTMVANQLAYDPSYFEMVAPSASSNEVARNFVDTPDYKQHELVLQCQQSGGPPNH